MPLIKGRSISLNMTSHDENSTDRPPLFDGTNFSFWEIGMKKKLMSLGVDVWDVIEMGYVKPVVLASKYDKLEFRFNAKEINSILSGLAEAEFVKFMHCDSEKAMWDKLISSYEGNEKVKGEKIQTHGLKFEQLKMDEDKNITKYFLRIEELVNTMKYLGETIDESFLVQKILRSLPNRFNSKVFAIEEIDDLKTLTLDQLLGTLIAYEMRITKGKSTTREAYFKVEKKTNSDIDEIEANFVRRPKKGSGKYKGKLPFKCFNYGKIGHFASKCPHKRKDQTYDDEDKHKHKKVYKENKFKKKSLCVNNDDDPSDVESTDSSIEDKINDIMIIALEYLNIEDIGSDFTDCEAIIDLEGELVSAMEEIDRLREKKRNQKQLLIMYEKKCNEPYEEISLLKVKLEESNKIEDILKQQLKEVETKGEKLEAEVVTVRKDLEKYHALYHQNMTSIKASEGLVSILNQQRDSKLKTSLGYEEGSSSSQPSNK
jgi:hypothetical protein